MKFMYLLQGETIADQCGFHSAFEILHSEGKISSYHVFPWRGYYKKNGWPSLFQHIYDLVHTHLPDILYFQFFHEPSCPDVTALFSNLRTVVPSLTIILSAGDAFSPYPLIERHFPIGFISAAINSDITFLTAMGRCSQYLSKRGVSNILLLPLGVCQDRFAPDFSNSDNYKPDFDVVFIGGGGGWYRYDPLNFSFHSGFKRFRMVQALTKRYGKKFGLFGRRWHGNSSWQGEIPFSQQVNVCKNSQVIFGGCPGIYEDYYTSDRPFIQGTSGIPMVDWVVPRVNSLLRNNDHWYLVNDKTSLIKQIDFLLESDITSRLQRGKQTAYYINSNLSQLSLMRFLLRTASEVHLAHRAGKVAPPPDFDYFLPEINIDQEAKYAICNWIG